MRVARATSRAKYERMSRSGFSIRKLINQRRAGSDSDEDNDEEAFECSSAKTIRMQYELEQYQNQQLQREGRHHLKPRASLVNNGSTSPRKTGYRRVPKPITVSHHAGDDVMVQSAGMNRRLSTPEPLSSRSLAGRNSPATPRSRISDESACPFCGADRSAHHRCEPQHLDAPERSARRASPSKGHWIPKWHSEGSLMSPVRIPAPPLTRKVSYEKLSPVHDTSIRLPSPDLRIANPRTPSPPQSIPTATYKRSAHVRTPSLGTPTDSAVDLTSRSSSAMSTRTPKQQSTFVNGQPSPPLEPEDDSRRPLVAVPPQSNLAMDGERTWFLSEVDEEPPAVPDDVEQLMRETEKVFRQVSSGLAATTLMHRRQPSSEEQQLQVSPLLLAEKPSAEITTVLQTLPPTTYQGPRTPTTQSHLVSPMSPTAGAGRGTFASSRKNNKSVPLSPSSSIRRSPTTRGNASVSKPKRAPKSPKSAAIRSASLDASASGSMTIGSPGKGHRQHQPHSYHRSLVRLNLAADKVTDKIFEGRGGRLGFIKVEADEVITPSQVQLFRRNRLAKAQAEAERSASSETLRSGTEGVGDESADGVAGKGDNTHEPSHGNFNGSQSVVTEASLPQRSLSPSLKETTRQTPIITAEPDSPMQTKEFSIGQNQLVTPPATPPQPSATLPLVQSSPASHADEDDSIPMHSRNIGFPKLPSSRRLSHTRAAPSLSHFAQLPTIPEVRLSALPSRDASQDSQERRKISGQNPSRSVTAGEGSPYFEEDDEHMFFLSTPMTATMPAFQHGRIRLAKDDLANAGTIQSLESTLLTSPDETLDWTAFQMAILGGAGEFLTDPDNLLAGDAQEEMVDDLCSWFEDLGFSSRHLGHLVTSESASSLSTPTHSRATGVASSTRSSNRAFHDRSSSRTLPSHPSGPSDTSPGLTPEELRAMAQMQSLPIPITSEHPSGFWSIDDSATQTPLAAVRSRFAGRSHASQPDALSLSSSGGSSTTVRASVDSLPQSPMLDLRMTTAADGTKELVPMGYNLGHDLGDFLKWESEHVYASGFYGSV